MLLGVGFFACHVWGLAANDSDQILAKAVQLFGEPLSSGNVRSILPDGNYVVWLTQ